MPVEPLHALWRSGAAARTKAVHPETVYMGLFIGGKRGASQDFRSIHSSTACRIAFVMDTPASEAYVRSRASCPGRGRNATVFERAFPPL